MCCEEELQLIASYANAIGAYHVAVAELEFGMIAASAEVYATLRQKTEPARAVCEAARKELDDHEVNHKCWAWTARAADPSRGVRLHRLSPQTDGAKRSRKILLLS